MPDLLFLVHRIPYPPTKGEKIRPYNMIVHLRRFFDIHLGCIIDDPADWAHVDAVRGLCASTYFAGVSGKRRPLSYLAGLLSGNALSVQYFRDAGLQRWVDDTLRQVKPETVFLFSGNIAPYILGHDIPRARLVADLVDVDSEKWRSYAEKARFPLRWVYEREARLVFALEQRVAHEFDAVTLVSDAEAELFRRLVPDCAPRISGVSNGVDLDYFAPGDFSPPFSPAAPTYVFTGTMDYPPNVDAVRWFAQEIMPALRRNLPETRFFIVGNRPTPSVKSLAGLPGVHVTGAVPDVRPYTAHATACVAPLRIARGIQNKVLEAMAMARPTIVTPQALEGIEVVPGRDLLLASDRDEFAAAASRVATDPSFAAEIGKAARIAVERDYSWPARLAALDPIVGVPGAALA